MTDYDQNPQHRMDYLDPITAENAGQRLAFEMSNQPGTVRVVGRVHYEYVTEYGVLSGIESDDESRSTILHQTELGRYTDSNGRAHAVSLHSVVRHGRYGLGEPEAAVLVVDQPDPTQHDAFVQIGRLYRDTPTGPQQEDDSLLSLLILVRFGGLEGLAALAAGSFDAPQAAARWDNVAQELEKGYLSSGLVHEFTKAAALERARAGGYDIAETPPHDKNSRIKRLGKLLTTGKSSRRK